jgi:hypothetical protein
VSRTFVERTRRAFGELIGRRLDDLRLAVMMLDGLELRGCTTLFEAERQFRRVTGYRDLATLAVAIEHDVANSCAVHTVTKKAAALTHA